MTNSDHGPQQAPPNNTSDDQASKAEGPASADVVVDSSSSAPSTPQILMLVGVVLAVLVGYYWSILALIEVWETNPNYSHGYVVPFFALGLGWVAFTRTNVLPISDQVRRRDVIWGGIEIAIGFALHILAMFTKLDFLDVVGLIFILLGILLAFGGQKANRAYALPVFFLIFMAPLPGPVYDPVARVLQHFAAIVSVALFDAFGILAERSGIIITLVENGEQHVMHVAGACSGMRSLTAILALAVAIAYLSGRKMGYCTLLVLMAGPVAIAVNCIRVFITGLIMVKIDPKWATGTAHEVEGMVMIGIAAAILALIAWIMAGIADWKQESVDKENTASSSIKPALETS